MKLLLVDDEVSLLHLLGQFLSRQGHIVETAATGAEALVAGNAGSGFDAAIIDLSLPDSNGVEVATALLHSSPDLRVVLTSGYLLEIELVPPVLRPRVQLLQKPFLPRTLAQVLAGWASPAPAAEPVPPVKASSARA